MNKRVAVIQFPGNNSEYETCRSVREAGMDAEIFRWNDDYNRLNNYDGFIIVGGFAYEDRGRAGLIASMDPIMGKIKEQAALGKPVLGICNGAQVLVETGLVPGGKNNELLLCLARNRKMKNGEQIGAGFYNENINMRSSAPRARTAFTIDFEPEEIAWAPVAHGEGRFTTIIPELFETLRQNFQIIFRYSDGNGKVDSDFPVNPNGAMDNAAAISNAFGNVMAIMPHPERAPSSPMPKIFTSMRKYMEGTPIQGSQAPLEFAAPQTSPKKFAHKANTLEYYIQLIITDNEAQTIENALRLRGFDVRLRKWVHIEVSQSETANQSEFFNSNKETAIILSDGNANLSRNIKNFRQKDSHYFLVRDLGESKIKRGTFWEVTGEVDIKALLATNIFANPHAQELFEV